MISLCLQASRIPVKTRLLAPRRMSFIGTLLSLLPCVTVAKPCGLFSRVPTLVRRSEQPSLVTLRRVRAWKCRPQSGYVNILNNARWLLEHSANNQKCHDFSFSHLSGMWLKILTAFAYFQEKRLNVSSRLAKRYGSVLYPCIEEKHRGTLNFPYVVSALRIVR